MGMVESYVPDGYEIEDFPDVRIVVKKAETARAGELREILHAVWEGRTGVFDLRAVTAGRGDIFLADAPGWGEIVIRAYRHGGVLGRLWGTFFFSPRRFLNELKITELACGAGVTSLEPVGIAYRRSALGVRGFWVSRRMAGAESLHSYMTTKPPTRGCIEKVALTVAKMHEGGIGHADLNIQNIMVAPGEESLEVSVIDFDKAVHRPVLTPGERIRQLRRLDRSLLKWLPEHSAWRCPFHRLRFAAVYSRRFPDTRPLLKAYLRNFEKHQRSYRLGWVIQSLLGVSKKQS